MTTATQQHSDIVITWHGSLQWGRRHVEEWHFLVKMYAETMKILEAHPDVKMVVQFGGQDVEWISHTHPEFIEQIRWLIGKGQVEVAVGGYSHNFQGNTPSLNVANLVYAQEVCRNVFGVSSYGYWPAESMLNRGMPKALKEAGFEYTFFDTLNVKHAGRFEYELTGGYHFLKGAFGESIAGLPSARYRNHAPGRRGEGAGILVFSQNPAFYDYDPAVILERLKQGGLVCEISDWEHFNLRQEKEQEIHMGTFSIGSANKIDPEKLKAWDQILTLLVEVGHNFITGHEALSKYSPKQELELIDGRDYTKNDLTRLVDATGWYDCAAAGGLSERKDPHRISDQESLSYSFAGAKALAHLEDIKAMTGLGYDRIERTKDVLISFCSAHRSGGMDFTVKQQLMDRVDRAIGEYQSSFRKAKGLQPRLLVPTTIPDGIWPIPVNSPELEGDTFIVSENGKESTTAFLQNSPRKMICVDQTHRLWIQGPLSPGNYDISPTDSPKKPSVSVSQTGSIHTLSTSGSMIAFDAGIGGNLIDWQNDGFKPVTFAGNVEANSKWQDAPLVDEVNASSEIKAVPGGIVLKFSCQMENVPVTKQWFISNDLSMCLLDIGFDHRRFAFLAPFAYRLNSREFGNDAKALMIAEGGDELSSEPMKVADNIHHLGSELLGFEGTNGLLGISINRLYSSPILRRNPMTGQFIVMDSRPLGAADNAFPYDFAWEPAMEIILRSRSKAGEPEFRLWQEFHLHPPILLSGKPSIQAATLAWTEEFEHISKVNPYF